MTAWRAQVPEAEEPIPLLAPAAAACEPKHRLKGAEEVGSFYQRALRSARGKCCHCRRTHERGLLLSQAEKPIGDETKAGEDKRVDIEEDL